MSWPTLEESMPEPNGDGINIYFSDYFGVPSEVVEEAGAFNISLINDLPLFIDPFLLFNSQNPQYQKLHDEMICYLRFLRDKSIAGRINEGLLRAWFKFSEVKQTWLGFSREGNGGSGLGMDFARTLNANLNSVFSDFGHEDTNQIARGSHLEKLCLISEGVGKDNISDFTTNLIKEWLLNYTQDFARSHVPKRLRRNVAIPRVRFNYKSEIWVSGVFELPYFRRDYVILTPTDMLTKDDTWINKPDLIDDYPMIVESVPNEQLRAQLNNYLISVLPLKPTDKDRDAAIAGAYRKFPQLLEYYIRYKEDNGFEAKNISDEKVAESKSLYIDHMRALVRALLEGSGFYRVAGTTYDEARTRVMFLKDVVENKDGYRIFYDGSKRLVRKEEDLHILYRLTWFGTPSDVNREVDNGRGPVDFSVSRGSRDKSLVEFKLASNPQLKRNLENQVAIYQKASDAQKALKVIFFFSREERVRVERILKDLDLLGNEDLVLVDARHDNKPSASKATSVDPGN